jgi:hypothetical protein
MQLLNLTDSFSTAMTSTSGVVVATVRSYLLRWREGLIVALRWMTTGGGHDLPKTLRPLLLRD